MTEKEILILKLISKVKDFDERANSLQGQLYCFSSLVGDLEYTDLEELVAEAALEIDATKQKLESIENRLKSKLSFKSKL